MRISTRTKIVIALLLVVLTGWNLHANHKVQQDLNFADRMILFITAPVQKAVHWSLGGLGAVFSGYVDLVGVEKENAALREQVAGWESMEIRLRELELENERLRRLADLRARAAVPSVGAEVIGWGTSGRFRVVRIDRGRAHGLRPGLGVIDASGVVGQVLHTSAGAADVLLLSDASSNLAARLLETRLRGIVRGDGRWHASLEFVNRQDATAVREDDLVVTSGDNAVFPAGIPVGRVASVEVAETGQFLTVTLRPASDLSNLQEVVVLLEPGTSFGDEVHFLPRTGEEAEDEAYGPPSPISPPLPPEGQDP